MVDFLVSLLILLAPLVPAVKPTYERPVAVERAAPAPPVAAPQAEVARITAAD